jgi:hypothetical protein
VLLSDGEFIESRMLVWCVGVRMDPLAEPLGQSTKRGWLLAEPHCQVRDRPEMFTCGDAIAVPDLDRPGNRIRATANWLLDAVLRCQTVQLGLARSLPVPLDAASWELAHVGGVADRHDSPSKGAT